MRCWSSYTIHSTWNLAATEASIEVEGMRTNDLEKAVQVGFRRKAMDGNYMIKREAGERLNPSGRYALSARRRLLDIDAGRSVLLFHPCRLHAKDIMPDVRPRKSCREID